MTDCNSKIAKTTEKFPLKKKSLSFIAKNHLPMTTSAVSINTYVDQFIAKPIQTMPDIHIQSKTDEFYKIGTASLEIVAEEDKQSHIQKTENKNFSKRKMMNYSKTYPRPEQRQTQTSNDEQMTENLLILNLQKSKQSSVHNYSSFSNFSTSDKSVDFWCNLET